MAAPPKRNWLFWTPRILCIIAILFISIFALDAFEGERSYWRQLLDFMMHLIPSLILLLFLIIAWKRELIGGMLFILVGLLFTPWVYNHNFDMNQSVLMSLWIVATITLPFIVVGILFLLSHFRGRRSEKNQT